MTNHTPGPWKVERHSHINGELWLTVVRGSWDITSNEARNPGVVASSKYSAMSPEENEANANLIASAPELLDVCLEAIDRLTEHKSDNFAGPEGTPAEACDLEDLLEQLLEVVAKAEGGE